MLSIFILSVILGIVLPSAWKLIMFESIADKFDQILSGATNDLHLTQRVFLNNLMVSTILYALGFSVILPIFIIISNGIMIGIFISLLVRAEAIMPGVFTSSIISLIPHGIFELSAFFIAGALSIIATIKVIFTKIVEPTKSRKFVLYESFMRFFILVMPLLIIAAFVEVYISNNVREAYLNLNAKRHINDKLQVAINPKFISDKNCHPNTKSNASEDDNAGTNLTSIATILYDEDINVQLKKRKQGSYWNTNYKCDDNFFIAIQVWSGDSWSIDQGIDLQKKILNISNADFKISNYNTNRIILNSENPDNKSIIEFLELNNKVVMLEAPYFETNEIISQ
ncbi:MAG: stage II sporulation protein M [bacterium]|nr:stage II sporulation protein M [bacterium]